MPLPKVDFPINQPVDLALQFAGGRDVPSNFGDGSQVMYSTTDGRKMYLSPTVAAKLAALKPQPGQLIRITKRERANGARGYDWTVEKLGAQPDGTYVIPKERAESAATSPEFAAPAQPAPVLTDKGNVTPVRKQPASEVLRHAIRLIDLHAECMTYAQKHGAAVTREDVRTFVTTAYIQAGRSGQLRRAG